MVSVCLPSDALSQHLPSYLSFSYLRCGVSLHGCSSKAQPLLFSLNEGYLLTTTPPDLERGVAPLGPPAPAQPLLLGHGVAPPDLRIVKNNSQQQRCQQPDCGCELNLAVSSATCLILFPNQFLNLIPQSVFPMSCVITKFLLSQLSQSRLLLSVSERA